MTWGATVIFFCANRQGVNSALYKELRKYIFFTVFWWSSLTYIYFVYKFHVDRYLCFLLEEVRIASCLFIGVEPQSSSPKNLISVQKVPLLEIDHFNLLDPPLPKILIIYLFSTYIHHKIYVNVLYSHQILWNCFGLIYEYIQ